MSYEGMKYVRELTSDDAIRGERAWAYTRGGKQVEIDTFWFMAKEEFAEYGTKPRVTEISPHYRNDLPPVKTVDKKVEEAEEGASDIVSAICAVAR